MANLNAASGSARRSGIAQALRAVLRCDGHEFIEQAYRFLLQREPDAAGLEHYLSQLNGGKPKLRILREINRSDEARERRSDVSEVDGILRRHSIYRLPVLGPVFNAADFAREMEMQGPGETTPVAALHAFAEFEANQLPSLLRSISEINHRQLSAEVSQENFSKSVPVALRMLTREVKQCQDSVGMMGQRVDGVEKAQDLLKDSAEKSTLDMVRRELDYVLRRVEFVRRELLFEQRYGRAPRADTQESLTTEVSILSEARLRSMRLSGLKLNLGCGHVPMGDYINVDRRKLPGVDVVAEIDDLPFEAGEVEEIFSSHLIEHFPVEQLRRRVLPYWLELLKPGGILRTIAPDADGMFRLYLKGECSFERLSRVVFGGQDYQGDFHFTMLNTERLTELLSEAGFVDIAVIAEDRVNGECRELEVSARRPLGPQRA